MRLSVLQTEKGGLLMPGLSWMLSLITPVLLHMILSDLSVIFMGPGADATLTTTAAAVLTIPIAAWMYLRDRKRRSMKENETERGQSGTNPYFFGIFCFLAGGILNLAWSHVLELLQIQQVFSNETQEALLASEMMLQIAGLGLLIPVAEELVFRGLVYNRMKEVFPVRLAILLSALLFAVYHGNPIQMIFAFPMALALTAVYEHGKLFLFPVLFHMGANLTAIFANYFF